MIFRPTYTRLDPKTGKKRRRKLRKWYVKVRLPDGTVKTVPGYPDREATRQLEARLLREAAREQEGMVNPYAEHSKRPLAEHVQDLRRYLTANGATERHVQVTCSRVRAVFAGCRFTRIADVQPSPVVEWLADLRKAGRISTKTSNYYQRDTKAFLRWLVKDGRTGTNPLAHLSGLNARTDVRRERRALTADELAGLLTAAGNSPEAFEDLTGADRRMLYATAMATGFRVSELASLTPSSFDLAALPPTATVQAAYAKNRKLAVQPLPADVAEALRGYLAGRPADQPLWPGRWRVRGAEMIRLDLAAAGIPFRDDAGRVADFHALRHSYITALSRSGVSPKVAQELARHADIRLTMQTYTHAGLYDLAAAVDSLPPILPTGPDREAATLAATGTDGGAHALLHTCAADTPSVSLAPHDTGETADDGRGVTGPASQKALEIRPFRSECDGIATHGTAAALPEPWTAVAGAPSDMASIPARALAGLEQVAGTAAFDVDADLLVALGAAPVAAFLHLLGARSCAHGQSSSILL
jgi:integrase